MRDRLDALARKEVIQVRKDVTELRRAVLTHTRMTGRALRQSAFLDEHAVHEQALLKLIERARRTGRPLLAGPWTGEVGFEVLYWIPFLRKLKARFPDTPSLHVLSRGGASPWYDGVASSYQEIFTLVEPEEFRRATDRETRKQRAVGEFDRRLLRQASRALGIARPIVVHPSLMYNLLYPYWKDQLSMRALQEYLEPAKLNGIDESMLKGVDLPPKYIAARFYFSQAFPDTEDNRTLALDVLRRAAARLPVVLLDPPVAVDDHRDFAADIPNVRSVAHVLTPANNLAVQSAIISRARGFVGTYGGFSYVAPLYGVPSVTFYSEETFFEQHLELARRTFSKVGAAPFVVLHTRERALVAELM